MAAGPIAVQQAPGDLEHLYCCAIGKSIFAFLPDNERARLVAELVFHRHKPATLADLGQLEAECRDIRAARVAFDRDEGPAPLACIAVPILDQAGHPVASVGISAIAALIGRPIDQHTDWIAAVKRCAARMAADPRSIAAMPR